eukprot:scaffold38389_cov70-Phaeocystis_antarctica.AAC.2
MPSERTSCHSRALGSHSASSRQPPSENASAGAPPPRATRERHASANSTAGGDSTPCSTAHVGYEWLSSTSSSSADAHSACSSAGAPGGSFSASAPAGTVRSSARAPCASRAASARRTATNSTSAGDESGPAPKEARSTPSNSFALKPSGAAASSSAWLLGTRRAVGGVAVGADKLRRHTHESVGMMNWSGKKDESSSDILSEMRASGFCSSALPRAWKASRRAAMLAAGKCHVASRSDRQSSKRAPCAIGAARRPGGTSAATNCSAPYSSACCALSAPGSVSSAIARPTPTCLARRNVSVPASVCGGVYEGEREVQERSKCVCVWLGRESAYRAEASRSRSRGAHRATRRAGRMQRRAAAPRGSLCRHRARRTSGAPPWAAAALRPRRAPSPSAPRLLLRHLDPEEQVPGQRQAGVELRLELLREPSHRGDQLFDGHVVQFCREPQLPAGSDASKSSKPSGRIGGSVATGAVDSRSRASAISSEFAASACPMPSDSHNENDWWRIRRISCSALPRGALSVFVGVSPVTYASSPSAATTPRSSPQAISSAVVVVRVRLRSCTACMAPEWYASEASHQVGSSVVAGPPTRGSYTACGVPTRTSQARASESMRSSSGPSMRAMMSCEACMHGVRYGCGMLQANMCMCMCMHI